MDNQWTETECLRLPSVRGSRIPRAVVPKGSSFETVSVTFMVDEVSRVQKVKTNEFSFYCIFCSSVTFSIVPVEVFLVSCGLFTKEDFGRPTHLSTTESYTKVVVSPPATK